MKLNLGCGYENLTGYVNVDIIPMPTADVVHDLDMLPWPFEDGSCEEIRAMDIFEHVCDPVGFMNESHRILRAGGLLHIRTNYWNTKGSYRDPTHKRFCTEETFDPWIPGTYCHQRYGMYARGRHHFAKESIYPDGEGLEVFLRKI